VLAETSCSLKFVLTEISCSRVFKLLFRFHQLLIRLIVIKSVVEKKKKKIENLIWFLFFSCSCSNSGSCSCSCFSSCSYSGSCSCSCFLGLITSWDKTKYHD
jgi:hypothetical protein